VLLGKALKIVYKIQIPDFLGGVRMKNMTFQKPVTGLSKNFESSITYNCIIQRLHSLEITQSRDCIIQSFHYFLPGPTIQNLEEFHSSGFLGKAKK
jgi:hypothetical protein